jgi:hypothetical protein
MSPPSVRQVEAHSFPLKSPLSSKWEERVRERR